MNWIVQAYADMYNVALGNPDRNKTVFHRNVEPHNAARAREDSARGRVGKPD